MRLCLTEGELLKNVEGQQAGEVLTVISVVLALEAREREIFIFIAKFFQLDQISLPDLALALVYASQQLVLFSAVVVSGSSVGYNAVPD